MLVVVVIIAILAALVILALSSASKRAKEARAKSSVRSVQTALEIMYTDFNGNDMRGKFPGGGYFSVDKGNLEKFKDATGSKLLTSEPKDANGENIDVWIGSGNDYSTRGESLTGKCW